MRIWNSSISLALGYRSCNGDNSAMTAPLQKKPPLTPKYWGEWLLVGLLGLLGKAPQSVGLAISVPLGWLMARLMKRRRLIAQRNIERCFPELSGTSRDRLLADHFNALARMVFEVTWAWSGSVRRLEKLARYEGLEHIEREIARGQGVLAYTAHVTCLEMGGRLAAFKVRNAAGVYRPLKHPVIEWYQNRSRAKYSHRAISKRDMRSAVRFLRGGGVMWYAPDQDFGAARSVFAPFFGIQTATLEGTQRLVELSGCRVVPMYPIYDRESRKYIIRFFPALENFPSGDIVQDLTRINLLMEKQIRQAPEQYWWIHRRFKTRPEGEAPFYD